VYDVEVKDSLITDDGVNLGTYVWDLGNMSSDEKVIISYDVIVNGGLEPGQTYNFVGRAIGEDHDSDEVRSKKRYASMIYAGSFGFGSVAYAADRDTQEALKEEFILPNENDGIVLGHNSSDNNTGETCQKNPLWILLAALVAYGFFINWALFPKKHS
jgi:hypothetical protein